MKLIINIIHYSRVLRYSILIISTVLFLSLQIAPSKNKIEKVQFLSCDTIKIEGKLWLPASANSDKIVIQVVPCLNTKFSPESDPNKTHFDVMVREKLLSKGIAFFEFIGRKESVLKYERLFPTSTRLTKAQDLDGAIEYIRSRNDLKHKKIVLIGQSEGGMTSVMAASKNHQIHSLVLISTPAVSGHEIFNYQFRCADTVFMNTLGTDSRTFEAFNSLTSLKHGKYDQSIEGLSRFRSDTYGPLEQIIDRYENYDTIAAHVMNYIEDRWKKEDVKTQTLHKNFKNYCNAYHHLAYIQPEQIELRKWNPELYFRKISCPVLAVCGTNDKFVEYSSSIKNMEKLLTSGGNNRFTAIILKNCDHVLQNRRVIPTIQDSSVARVVDWIIKN